jgi:hydroxymethylpyrimidine/phosphomethylpyrimidine kinase
MITPTVLSIAGLDPSGGAGIGADLKTATALKTYGMSVLTTMTVQHPGSVSMVAPLPSSMVRQQLEAILSAMPIGAIKIGLLGNTEIAEVVVELLAEVSAPIVVDPVRRSTSGTNLNQIDDGTFRKLLRIATIVTPNCDELADILGELPAPRWAIENQTALLHTGGHREGEIIEDVLWLPDGSHRRWSHPRIPTSHTHGSGCTLSTAIATGLATGMSTADAVQRAIQFTARLISESTNSGLVNDNGPLLHFKHSE